MKMKLRDIHNIQNVLNVLILEIVEEAIGHDETLRLDLDTEFEITVKINDKTYNATKFLKTLDNEYTKAINLVASEKIKDVAYDIYSKSHKFHQLLEKVEQEIRQQTNILFNIHEED